MTSGTFVAVLGPPGSGKTTLTAALCDRAGGVVFRLRESAYDYATRSGADHRTWLADDRREWLRDDAVELVLGAALLTELAGEPLVWLENFPGTARQLRLVQDVAATGRAGFAVVELVVPDEVLWRRVRARRVCRRCEPDPRGDPHRPADEDPVRPGHCARCGATLARRRGDGAVAFTERLARWQRHSAAIRRDARTRGIPYRAIDAAGAPSECVERALRALPDLSGTGCTTPMEPRSEEDVLR